MDDLNDVYWQRNQLVCALSKIWPSCIGMDAEDPDWPIVYIHSPEGQLSWHIPAKEVEQYFGHLDLDYYTTWDGHTTEEKYERLKRVRMIQSTQ